MVGSSTPVKVDLPQATLPVKDLAGGQYCGYALGADDVLYAWGLNTSGQLGNGTRTSTSRPTMVNLPEGEVPVMVTASGNHASAYALTADGNVFSGGAPMSFVEWRG